MQLQVVQRRCKTTRFRAWNSFHRLHTMISTRLRFNGDMRREKPGWVLNGLTVNSFWFRWFRWSCVKSTFNNLWLKSWTLAFGVRIEKSWKIHWWFREKLAEVWKKHQVPKHISLKIVIDHGKYSKKVVVRKSLFWSNWYELILFDIFWRYPELTQAHRHTHTHYLYMYILYTYLQLYTPIICHLALLASTWPTPCVWIVRFGAAQATVCGQLVTVGWCEIRCDVSVNQSNYAP